MSKKLSKSGKDIVIDGICAGIADYLDIDPLIVRMIFIFFSGQLIPVYLLLMFIMPEVEQ